MDPCSLDTDREVWSIASQILMGEAIILLELLEGEMIY